MRDIRPNGNKKISYLLLPTISSPKCDRCPDR